jgi:hypothetical protein
MVAEALAVAAGRSASLPHVDAEELGRRAPTWVPDAASAACQQCSRAFSFVVRRHHCRSVHTSYSLGGGGGGGGDLCV